MWVSSEQDCQGTANSPDICSKSHVGKSRTICLAFSQGLGSNEHSGVILISNRKWVSVEELLRGNADTVLVPQDPHTYLAPAFVVL